MTIIRRKNIIFYDNLILAKEKTMQIKKDKKDKKAVAIVSLIMVAVMAVISLAFVGCKKEINSAPVEKAGESTVIESVNGSPAELSATDVAFAYLGKQKSFTSYKTVTTGSTKAEKGIIKYEQKINNAAYKNGDEYFENSTSNSVFVKMQHQAFVKGDKVVYRNSADGELYVSEKANYKDVYGVSPDDVALGGYIMNAQTIRFAEKTQENDGLLTYRFVLDGATAGVNAVKQMKEFGGLDGYPVFHSVVLYLTVKSDWTPVKLLVESNYDISIKVLGNLTCTQSLTTEFSDVQGKVEIPSTEEFNAKLGTTPTEVVGGESQKSPFMHIAETFAEQDYDKGVHFGVNFGLGLLSDEMVSDSDLYLKVDKTAIANKDYLGAVSMRMDIDVSKMGFIMVMLPMAVPGLEDTAILSSTENLSGVSLYYIGDGNLYVAFKDNNQTIRKIITVDLIQTLASVIKGIDFNAPADFDPAELITELTRLFDVSETAEGTTFALKQEYVEKLNAAYGELLNEIASAAGDMGMLVTMMLNAELDGLEIKTANADGVLKSVALSVTGKKIGYDGTSGESKPLISLGLSIEGNLTDELNGDKQTIEAVLVADEAAAVIRDQIKLLEENMWLGDTYVARVNALVEKYNELTLEQRILVLNSCKITDDPEIWAAEDLWYATNIIDKHNGLKSSADEFITKLETVDEWTDDDFKSAASVYARLADCQAEYIGAENIAKYLDAVEKHNAEQPAA